MDFNEPEVFDELLALPGVDVLIYNDDNFHPKGYVFASGNSTTAIVGSSNLTINALTVNQEWNIRFSASDDEEVVQQISTAVEKQLKNSTPLTPEWIKSYEESRKSRVVEIRGNQPIEKSKGKLKIVPNPMQAQALEALDELYQSDHAVA